MDRQIYKKIAEEIASDPLLVGYSVMLDNEIAASLNNPIRPRTIDVITGRQIASAIDSSEYNALTDAEKLRVIEFTNNPEPMEITGFMRDAFRDIFGNGAATISALQSIAQTTTTRAAEIGIVSEGRRIKVGWVTSARAQ